MLVSFLETGWPQLDEAQHEAFERLLDQEDDELIDWLISGREGPPDAAIRDVVERIRKHMGL